MALPDRCNSADSENRFIYVVGTRNFENELLAFFLNVKLEYRILILDEIETVPSGGREDDDRWDFILYDCMGMRGEEILVRLESMDGGMFSTKLVILFNLRDNLNIEASAIKFGARGFFYETDTLDILLKGFQRVYEGDLWISREKITECLLRGGDMKPVFKKDRMGMTPRELEILNLLATGSTNEKISDQLCISPHTVKTHVYNLFKKIKVHNRLQAALWVERNL